ncbi:MAG: nucleoside-triphosphatase, partial [bacterium]
MENLDAHSEPPVWEEEAEIGKAYRIGITGPLGVGKSTLVNGIARQMRMKGWRVGILAVDPSSPISGGALLGDRVRMTDLVDDDGVFIRSFATRGAWGGLAPVTSDAADLLDQAGFERILIETVGVGQIEVDIAGACDLTIVVLEPSSGDAIQT